MVERSGGTPSQRARRVLEHSNTAPYIFEHLARTTDENGYVCLAIAENRLMADLLSEKADAVRNVPTSAFTYDDMPGSAPFRGAVARTLTDHLMGVPVDPDHVVGMAGAGAVVEALGWILADPGAGVLVPTPSYTGYWNDLETRIGVHVVPAHTRAEDDFRIDPGVLDASAAGSAVDVAALLLTNPSNPLGRTLTVDEITGAVEWAREQGIPVIVNEVYGLSSHREGAFTSVAAVLGGMADDLHFVWAASKDLASSGLRAGVLATTNDDVRAAAFEHQYFSAISGDTQHLIVTMLDDPDWTGRYLTALRERLSEAAGRATGVLAAHGIGFVPPDAGIFVLADMRPFLIAPTWEAEDRLWRAILEETGVNLTPGSACRAVEPGWMRICFAAAPTDVSVRSLESVGRFLRTRGGA